MLDLQHGIYMVFTDSVNLLMLVLTDALKAATTKKKTLWRNWNPHVLLVEL